MKLFLITISIFIVSCNSNSKNQQHSGPDGNKENPMILTKEAEFVHVQLELNAFSTDSIIGTLFYTNESEDTIMLYKPLLPDNAIQEDVFSIFSSDTYDEVPFTGKRYLHEYVDGYQAGAGFVAIKPDSNSYNFIPLMPHQKLRFESNVAAFYDFKQMASGSKKKFKIVPIVLMPVVGNSYMQKYEVDSADNVLKPVYYEITMPRKKDIDSMRIEFSIPH